jgi:hypothetical protein
MTDDLRIEETAADDPEFATVASESPTRTRTSPSPPARAA